MLGVGFADLRMRHGRHRQLSAEDIHVPVRMCLGCRVRRPARELIRFAVVGDDMVVVDGKHKLQGRGCYACPEEACVDNALKRGRIERALRKQFLVIPSTEVVMRGFSQKGRSDDYDDR